MQAHPPMAEVGEGDNGVAADAHHLLQHLPRVARRLQRQAEDGIVEGPGGVLHQVGVGIALDGREAARHAGVRSEEHTSELQSLMRISYAVFCLKKKTHNTKLKREHTTKTNL